MGFSGRESAHESLGRFGASYADTFFVFPQLAVILVLLIDNSSRSEEHQLVWLGTSKYPWMNCCGSSPQHFCAGFWPWTLLEIGPSNLIRGTYVKWQGQLKTGWCTFLQPLSWHASVSYFRCFNLMLLMSQNCCIILKDPLSPIIGCYPPPKWAPKPLEKMLSLAAERVSVSARRWEDRAAWILGVVEGWRLVLEGQTKEFLSWNETGLWKRAKNW